MDAISYTVLKGWKVPLQNIKKSENFRLLKSYTIVLGTNNTIIKNITKNNKKLTILLTQTKSNYVEIWSHEVVGLSLCSKITVFWAAI